MYKGNVLGEELHEVKTYKRISGHAIAPYNRHIQNNMALLNVLLIGHYFVMRLWQPV